MQRVFGGRKEQAPMETADPSENDIEDNPTPETSGEVSPRPELEFQPVVDKLRELFDLPPVVPITRKEVVAGWFMEFAIAKKVLRLGGISRKAMHTLSGWMAENSLVDYPEDTPAPPGAETTSPWAFYRIMNLQSNKNINELSPEEWERRQHQLRFNICVPIEKPDPNVDIRQAVFSVLEEFNPGDGSKDSVPSGNKDATGRVMPDGSIKPSFKLKVTSVDDIVVLDLQGKKWADLETGFEDKVVYIKNDFLLESSAESKDIVKKLLDNNRLIIRETHDSQLGCNLELSENHNWGDAHPHMSALCQIAQKVCAPTEGEPEPLAGIRRIDDNDLLQQTLDAVYDRFNYGDKDTDGSVRSFVIPKELTKQIDDLYLAYKKALPTREQITELFKSVKGHKPEDTEAMVKAFQGLSKARLLQLLVGAVGGATDSKLATLLKGKSVKAGLLRFDSNEKIELDHYTITGNLGDVQKALTELQNPDVSVARNAVRTLFGVLDFYNDKKSNMSKIGAVLKYLSSWQWRLKLANAAELSGATRFISGNIMATYSNLEYYPLTIKKGEPPIQSKRRVYAIPSPAQAGTDLAFAIVGGYKEDAQSLDDPYEQLIISIKANWSQKSASSAIV